MILVGILFCYVGIRTDTETLKTIEEHKVVKAIRFVIEDKVFLSKDKDVRKDNAETIEGVSVSGQEKVEVKGDFISIEWERRRFLLEYE